MDDSRSPPDAEGRAGTAGDDSAHSAGLKLSGTDAEAARPAMADTEAPASEAASEPAETLDAFIDSIPAEPPGQAEAQMPEEMAKPAASVSSIFESLGPHQTHAAEQPAEPQPLAEDAGGSAASDVAEAVEAEDVAQGAPAGGASGLGVPLFYQPVAAEPADWQPVPAPDDGAGDAPAQPPEGDPGWEAPSGEADRGATYPEAAEEARAAKAGDGDEPLGEPWPPFPEPPGSQPGDADVEPLKPPSLVTNPEPVTAAPASPFPAPPAWPPHLDPPGDEAAPQAQATSGLPPYIELPAHPEGEDDAPPPPAPSAEPEASPRPAASALPPLFSGPQGGSLPPGPDHSSVAAASSEQRERETGASIADAATRARIAAEADATAQALDNLQRLLNKTAAPLATPQPQPQPFRASVPPPRPQHSPHVRPHQDDPFGQEMAPMLPLPMPPTDEAGDRRVYLLGFLTGLVLSVMAGAALYFLINTG